MVLGGGSFCSKISYLRKERERVRPDPEQTGIGEDDALAREDEVVAVDRESLVE